ncbi:patellin-5, partial [Striga asiatica]
MCTGVSKQRIVCLNVWRRGQKIEVFEGEDSVFGEEYNKLDFSPGGINTILDQGDLFSILQFFVNVPLWYLAFCNMRPRANLCSLAQIRLPTPFSSEYILPEQVPIQYGSLRVDYCECECECNPDFIVDDPAMEITVKPSTEED